MVKIHYWTRSVNTLRSNPICYNYPMRTEREDYDPDWEAFTQDLEVSRAKETARQSILEVLSSHIEEVEELLPYQIADEVLDDLTFAGFDTQRSVRLRWEVAKEPQAGFIDVLAQDPETGFLAALQFDFDIPTRGHVEVVNRLSPSPDLALFVLARPRLPTEKLATAVRDVKTDFLIFGLAEGGEPLLTPEDRDRLRKDVE